MYIPPTAAKSLATGLILELLTVNAAAPPQCSLGSGAESHTVGGSPSGPVWPWQIYQSSPFNPPELQITSNGATLASGLLFITPSNGGPVPAVKEAAPLILTDQGQLVWNGPSSNATNLRVAKFEDRDILTYWSGLSTAGANIGHGYGNVTFLDSTYDEILVVCPKLGLVTPDGTQFPCEADLHESYVTDRNTLLVTAYNATPADLSSIGGPKDGWIFDCLFFEIEPRSNKILFSWSAIEHVPVSQTKQPLGTSGTKASPFDYFHINSVVNIGDTYLANSRHTWSTFLISAKGQIEWTIQGDTGGDFGSLPANGHFRWQHHPRPHSISKSSISISFFNNYNSAVDNGTNPSTGLELKLSLPPDKSKSPEVLLDLSDPSNPIYDDSQGSTDLLHNGNVFLGYGQIPVLKEFGLKSPTGADIRWTARFGKDNVVQSYRGFKQVWHAYPKSSPSLAVVKATGGDGCSTGYVSWNGATEVTAWEILEGDTKSRLYPVGTIRHKGFETKFTVAKSCVQAVALYGGRRAASSNVVCN